MNRRQLSLSMATALVFSIVTSASAALIVPSGWTQPTTDAQASTDLTTYQRWEVFSTTTGPNAPDIAEINPNGVANAYDASAPASGAFITSGGNMYSFAAVLTPRVIVPQYNLGAGYNTQVLVQVKYQGQDIDINNVTFSYLDSGNPVSGLISAQPGYSYTEISRVALGGFGGAAVEAAWAFTLPANPSSLQIDFGWGVSSSSLDQIAVDTAAVAVPEPATIGFLSIGALALLQRRRRTM